MSTHDEDDDYLTPAAWPVEGIPYGWIQFYADDAGMNMETRDWWWTEREGSSDDWPGLRL